MNDIELLYIDLFCGAGGTSTGVNSARLDGRQCAQVVACVNHDKNAIASHAVNHPEAMHFTEDIRTLELSPLLAHLQSCRKQNPDALVVLWASLECTNKIKLAMHYGAERKKLLKESYYFRQPYTIAQQRKAMKVLGLTKYIEFYAGISRKR